MSAGRKALGPGEEAATEGRDAHEEEVVAGGPVDVGGEPTDPAGEIGRVSAELSRLTAEAAKLEAEENARTRSLEGTEGEGGGTPVRSSSLTPEETKATMAALHSRVVRTREKIAAKREEIQKLLEEQLAPVKAQIRRLERFAGELQEGIWTVNLYLGRDEQIVALADGEPAAADEPITVRQLVLAMDEECAVAAETGGIDAMDVDKFDAWLVSDPAHVEQVIPEKKGVVALVPRHRENSKDYGDAWVTSAVAKANQQTYFLIRNGEKLCRTWTDFNVGRRLVPARDEFTSFFEERRYDFGSREDRKVRLEPGTYAWTRAEEAADARKRHYMRVALILQGLLDRTTVFHPLPQDDIGVGFLEERHYFAHRVRIIMDAEPALASAGHVPFREWQRRLNAELRPGMRLIGAFGSTEWYHARGDEDRGHERLYPRTASYPKSGVPYAIKERGHDGALVFRYERTDEVEVRDDWGYREYRKARTRASCTVYPWDQFVLPFDLAEVGEMERFLHSRLDRREYVAMFPLMKDAIRAKREEAAAEEPFRRMLAGVLARENGVEVAAAEEDVPALVAWWKLANRHHRPLVSEAPEESRAIRAIVAEHERRLDDRRRREARPDDPAELASVRIAHPGAVLVARKRDASWVVLVPERPEGAPDADVFVRELVYGAKAVAAAAKGGGAPLLGEPREDRPWRLVGSRAHRWRVLYEGPRWAGWDLTASPSDHLTDPEMEALADRIAAGVRNRADGGDPDALLAISYFPAGRSFYDERCFGVWSLEECAVVDEGRLLTGRLRGPEVDFDVYGWRRGRGGAPVLSKPRRGMGRPRRVDGRYPGVVLKLNEPAEERLEAEETRYLEAREAYGALRSRATALERSVEEAWEERARAGAYERFLQDYGDPGLWEGYLKTLDLRYPHRAYRGLSRVVQRLVEEGVDLADMTVGEATALAKKRGFENRGLAAVPEDLADLRFSAPEDDA